MPRGLSSLRHSGLDPESSYTFPVFSYCTISALRCQWICTDVVLKDECSENRLDALLVGEVEQLERGSARFLLAPLPLTHQRRRHVERQGEYALAHPCLVADPLDRARRQFLHIGETDPVELAHRRLVDDPLGIEILRGQGGRAKDVAAIGRLPSHHSFSILLHPRPLA